MLQYKIKSRNRNVFFCGLSVFLSFLLALKAAEIQSGSGSIQTSGLYSSSYALVIGIENYKNWPSFKQAVNDAVLVGNELEKLGFDVTYRSDLDLSELENNLRKFFYNVNIDDNSRLFLWFSLHGHTIDGEGLLVPTDAPPQIDPDFKRKAFPVKRLYEFSRLTKARYVYMVFNSCFSSTVFINERSVSSTITVASMLKYPVRQYLCSCASGQKRQENGAFREIFIKALRYDLMVDANRDNYMTASEIGRFIKNEMKYTTGIRTQDPHYGRLKDFERGEFVFLLQSKSPGYFRDRLKDKSYGPEMIKIPGGSFMMGDLQEDGFKDEKPVHEVNVAGIAVSRFEVTFEEYDLFCESTKSKKPYDNGWGRGNRPVIYVSWDDAVAYTRWLSHQTGFTYRLPTEAEWEYFARAGTETNYWWGNEMGQNNACCYGCSAIWGGDSYAEEKKTTLVGTFKPNPFGIFDTVGNVWEWTCSEYTDEFNESKKETKCLYKITTGGEVVVLRGGAWDEKPNNCRVFHRKPGFPGERSQFIGFRVVKELN